MSMGSTTTQEVKLSPEAKETMNKELSLFISNFLPAEATARGGMLRGLGPDKGGTREAAGTKGALNLAGLATKTAGEDAGLSRRGMTNAMQPLEQMEPEALGNLQNLFRQMAISKSGLVDPRFATFLKPNIETDTAQGSGQTAVQAAGLAIAIAGVAAAAL